MSHDDPFRSDQGRDRGAYTPPTDDELPFDRQGYDPRRGGYADRRRSAPGGGPKSPPITLIISGVVLLALIIAVAVYYSRSGLRASGDAPPAVGKAVDQMTVGPPIDAQPVDPEAGIDVYAPQPTAPETPTFAPPPEAVQPRPEPGETPAAPPPAETAPPTKTREPEARLPERGGNVPPPERVPENPAPAAGGDASVQIGAFSTPSVADIEYGVVRSRFPALAQGGQKRVQEVPGPDGRTLYRTSVTNLSREQAERLCGAIQSRGGQCIVR